jgi:hypothetical protein
MKTGKNKRVYKGISIAARKAKGRRLQQLVAKRLSKITGIPYGVDEDISSREMGQKGTDVKIRGHARDVLPYSIECKNQEKWNVFKDMEQAKDNTLEGTDWLLFYMRNRVKPVVMMDAELFFCLLDKTLHKKEKE